MKNEPKKESIVYLGPTIPGVVMNGTVFTNGYTERLKEELERKPFMKGVLVRVSDMAEKRTEIKRSGSPLNIVYQKLKED